MGKKLGITLGKRQKKLTVVGFDEAGRGPLFGPLSLAALTTFNKNLAKDFFDQGQIKDSKKLSSKKRQAIYQKILSAQKMGKLEFAHVFVSASYINQHGLRPALNYGVAQLITKLKLKSETDQLVFDGSLWGDQKFKQQTIIKGDEKVLEIALASIVAKEKRDQKVIQLAKLYPNYGLAKHKGYGTKSHLLAIKKYGPTKEHREWGSLK